MSCECFETSKKCLHACEKTIDAAQDLIAKCGGTDTQECSQEVGEMIVHVEQCLKACNDTITHCHHFIASTQERDAIHIAEECITSCEKTVAALEQVLGICRAGKPECLDACSQLVAACNNCAECCRKCIAMGI